jgi:perosamine synthetase
MDTSLISTNLKRAAADPSEPWVHALLPSPDPLVVVPSNGSAVIPVCDTRFEGNEREYVVDCLESGWISSAGPYVGRFEEAFADVVGTRHAISCSNGTVALHLMLAAAGIGAGDEVIVPTFTMAATAAAVAYLGADPVFVDVLPDTGNIDPNAAAAAMTSRTKAIIAVHVYGCPADVATLQSFASTVGADVFEDAAEAHGARSNGRPVGSLGRAGSFSFYANKIITTGEGGMVTTDDDSLAALTRTLRDHAFSADRHFWHRHIGFNYRMTAMQAAVGLAQVEQLSTILSRKAALAARYDAAFEDLPLHRSPHRSSDQPVTWMYGLRVTEHSPCSRDVLRRRLADAGIETRTFFVPLHLQPVWRERGVDQRLPNAEALSMSGLYLPSGPGLTDTDVDRVIDAVRNALSGPIA